MIPRKELSCGEVGYIISGIKNAREVKVGDTITQAPIHVKKLSKDSKKLNLWCLLEYTLLTLLIMRI